MVYYVVFGIPYFKTFAISKPYKYFKCAENFRYRLIDVLLKKEITGNISPFNLVYICFSSKVINSNNKNINDILTSC